MTNAELSDTGREWLREAALVGMFKRKEIAKACGIPHSTFYRVLLPLERGGHAPSDKTRRRFLDGIARRRRQLKEQKRGIDDKKTALQYEAVP